MLNTRYYFSDEFSKYMQIFSQYEHTKVSFKKSDLISNTMVQCHYNYFITKGFCKLSANHDSGEEKIIGYWGTGSIYPLVCTEEKFQLEQSLEITAVSDMETMQFNVDTIKHIISENPEIGYEIINHYGRFTNLLIFNSTVQTYEDVLTRVCNLLYIFYLNNGSKSIETTQREIASIIGATRESVVKALYKLRSETIIQTERNRINIVSIDKVLEYSSALLKRF